jgi:membrane protein required for colicin V production
MMWTWLDDVFILVLLLSLGLGWLRGVARELTGLGGLCIGAWVAYVGHGYVSPWLTKHVHTSWLRTTIACIILFCVSALLMAWLGEWLSQWLSRQGLGSTNRLFGMLFGILRGIALIILLYTVFAWFGLDETSEWHRSHCVPIIKTWVKIIRQTF